MRWVAPQLGCWAVGADVAKILTGWYSCEHYSEEKVQLRRTIQSWREIEAGAVILVGLVV